MPPSAHAPFPEAPRWQWLAWQPGARAEDAARDWLAPQLGCAPQAIALSRDVHGLWRIHN
jgi:hypothetical protein